MQSSPFRGIVLPSIISASAAFALFTLPLASPRASEMATQLPEQVSRWAVPMLEEQHKEFSIRYIGSAIITSVLVGVGISEGLRRRRAKAQHYNELLQRAIQASDSATAAASWVEDANLSQQAAIAALDPWQPDEEAAAVPQWEPMADGSFEETLDWGMLAAAAEKSQPTEESAALSTPERPIDPGQPRTFRVQVGGNQRLLAIQVDGEYYSFYRRRSTLDQAQAVLAQLQRRGKEAVMLQDEKGYGIWIHQPDALLDASPWGSMQPAS